MDAQLFDRGNMVMLPSGVDSARLESRAWRRRAGAAGAEIFLEPRYQDYGHRGYSCSDLEGHVWRFGSYDRFTDGS